MHICRYVDKYLLQSRILLRLRFFSACLLFVFPAQAGGDWNAGVSLGLSVYLGNKTDRVGAFVGAWVCYDFVQINSGARVYYNFKNLGPPGKYWEFNGYGGTMLTWGKRDDTENPFVTNVSNQTGRRYGIAYSYNIYCDGIGTSQKTGTVAVQLNKISIITENDLLGDNKDRYRTAAATVQYRHESSVFGLSAILWTGESGAKVTDTDYPSRGGYKESGRFGKYSHGILCVQAQQYLGYKQNLQAAAGIDAERIRHVFQNKIIHDYAFLPADWVKKPGAHVPMLDSEGNPYLFRPEQKIRKSTPYFNLAANPALFY